MNKEVDVLIIGGGLSGLALASMLKDKNISYIIIEGSPFVGGVIQSEQYKGRAIIKGPKMFLASRAYGLIKLSTKYNVPYALISRKMPKYLLSKSGLKRLSLSLIFKHPKLIKLITAKVKKTEESIEEFFLERLGQPFVEDYLEPFCAGIWAEEPGNLSMDHLMGGVKKKDFFKRKQKGLVSFPGGLSSLINAIFQDVKENVILGQKCTRIENFGDHVIAYTNAGIFKAKKIVIATSYKNAMELLDLSSLINDIELTCNHAASIDVVCFYFTDKQKRPFGSGYLIPKKFGYKTRGVLFDADLLSYKEGDLISCFIQEAKNPEKQAYVELKQVLGDIDMYEKAFVTSYPGSIFTCKKGLFGKLEALKGELLGKNVHLIGAYPKVGVCDVLDKAFECFETITSLDANIMSNKA